MKLVQWRLVQWRSAVTAAKSISDGKQLVSGSGDKIYGCNNKIIIVWNVKSGEKIRTLEGHTGCVDSVDVTPDNSKIVSASGTKQPSCGSSKRANVSTLSSKRANVSTLSKAIPSQSIQSPFILLAISSLRAQTVKCGSNRDEFIPLSYPQRLAYLLTPLISLATSASSLPTPSYTPLAIPTQTASTHSQHLRRSPRPKWSEPSDCRGL